MKTQSHKSLGVYLSNTYFPSVPRRYIQAFLLGCTQPDKNPITYLKGSIRCQWLRGHNWHNAQRFMARLCRRLENRKRLYLLDYYALGKLIHYTVDAFTSAHNDYFPTSLLDHRSYENRLQAYFLGYLKENDHPSTHTFQDVMEAIRTYHAEYAQKPVHVHTDSRYCVLVSSLVVCMLLA